MELILREENGVAVVLINGGLVQENLDEFKKFMTDLFDKGSLNVVLDMGKCSYVTSMVLAAVFGFKKKFNDAGGDVRIACINRLIRNLFQLTNLQMAADIFETVEEGVRSFQKT